jgi:hypothetical protein
MQNVLYRKRVRAFAEVGENGNRVAVGKFYLFRWNRIDIDRAVFLERGFPPPVGETGKKRSVSGFLLMSKSRAGNR